MTREEATKILQDIQMHPPIWGVDELNEACCMAIEALSEDISKDGTLTVKVKDGSKVNRVLVWGDNNFGGLYYPDEGIEALSAEAVHGWRKGKPTEQGKYMVTIDSFGHKHIDLFYYGKPLMPNRKVRGECWYRSDDEWGDVVYDDTDILAWQLLPKPYKGGDTE